MQLHVPAPLCAAVVHSKSASLDGAGKVNSKEVIEEQFLFDVFLN